MYGSIVADCPKCQDNTTQNILVVKFVYNKGKIDTVYHTVCQDCGDHYTHTI